MILLIVLIIIIFVGLTVCIIFCVYFLACYKSKVLELYTEYFTCWSFDVGSIKCYKNTVHQPLNGVRLWLIIIWNYFYHQILYQPTSDEHLDLYGASNNTLDQNATSRLTLSAPPKKFKPKDIQITDQPPHCCSQPCTPTVVIAQQVQFPIWVVSIWFFHRCHLVVHFHSCFRLHILIKCLNNIMMLQL